MDVYGVLGSGAMADPCWLACALRVIWCVVCAWVAVVVLVGPQGVSACALSREIARESVSLSLVLLSPCLSACVFGSAWMCTVCLAVERWLTLAGLLARFV